MARIKKAVPRAQPQQTDDIRPILRPIACMSTTPGHQTASTWADRCTAKNLYDKVAKLDWTLHARFNIPKCKAQHDCETCSRYVSHLEVARNHGGKRFREEEDDHMDTDTADSADGDSDEEELKDSPLDALFQLQDLMGKFRALQWAPSTAEHEKGGIDTLKLLQEETEAQKDAAQAAQVSLVSQLTALNLHAKAVEAKHDALSIQHGRILSERDQARTERNQAQVALADVNAKLLATLEELAFLRQTSDPDTYRPRKRVAVSTPSGAPSTMPRPTPHDPPEQLAQWLQFREIGDSDGIPSDGPEWIVDMRDVRGHQEVMCRVPPKARGQPVLRVLAVPGRYRELLSANGITVGPPDLSPCAFQDHSINSVNSPQPTDIAVAFLLAERGLTVAVADDAWQFCHKYVASRAEKTRSHEMGDLRRAINVALESTPRPAGLRSEADDRRPRPGPSINKNSRSQVFSASSTASPLPYDESAPLASSSSTRMARRPAVGRRG
ncbi:hypothetical protein B0H17DRAFT_1137844 [Mycena rosella]|uniref:Uncharacterized protein n=1 Tax=Mycena rosella TaxID=1033263 RepID=A0AAD7D890_MYCRO|nr:hypothetical protein B0H17DRAFT_1137844 [Mycena rosella]